MPAAGTLGEPAPYASPPIMTSPSFAPDMQDSPATVAQGAGSWQEHDIVVTDVTLAAAGGTCGAADQAAAEYAARAAGAPPAEGPLYKCSICGVFVYESQLDYHVLICPDPAEAVQSSTSAPVTPPMPNPSQVASSSLASPGAVHDQTAVSGSPMQTANMPSTVSRSPTPVKTEAGDEAREQSRLASEQDPFSFDGAAAEQHQKGDGKGATSRGGYSGGAARASGSGGAGPTGAASGRGSFGGAGGASASSRSSWKDMDVQGRQQAQIEYKSARQKELAEELQRKEMEECTFRPKTNCRGSRRWSQNLDPRGRVHKLKLVEAQAYADVTLKPKISRFAQVWSQRQVEAADGQPPPSVFDRLYSAALQSRIAREYAREQQEELSRQAAMGCFQEGDGTSISSGSQLQRSPQRRIPTTELLYSDAMDRRERLRSLAEQLQIQREEEARERTQVLGRSKRYYWQMLERQIKQSFDAVTGAEPTLRYSALEDFLVHFGLVAPPPDRCQNPASGWECRDPSSIDLSSPQVYSRTAASVESLPTAAGDEARRLRTSLWRHLDPQKTGHVDLLTLTIFLHVLMGAVDDQAKASLTVMPGNCMPAAPLQSGFVDVEADGTSSILDGDEDTDEVSVQLRPAGRPVGGGAVAPAADSGLMGLAAISEEDNLNSPRPIGPPGGEADGQDDEGQRIMELLVRFDPVTLRQEFKELYFHRLHYQRQQVAQMSGKNGHVDQEVGMPEINPYSRELAERVVERHRGELADGASHVDLMLHRHRQAQARIEEMKEQAKRDELKDCTFQPNKKSGSKRQEQVTPRAINRHQALYTRALEEKKRKEEKAKRDAKAREEAEVAQCTFQPNTDKSGRSYRVHDTGSAPVPRGFYESRQRLRSASEVERQKRAQREDRLAKVEPGFFPQLPPVAEDLPMRQALIVDQRRGSSAGAEVRRHSADRSRARSPPKGPQSPRGIGGVGAGSSARSPGVSPGPSRGGSKEAPQKRSASLEPPPTYHGRAAAAQAAVAAATAAANAATGGTRVPGAVDSVPAAEHLATGVDGQSGGGNGPVSPRSAPPLLFVDVNIAPGQPPERIVLREGQSVAEVAADFAAKHVLTPVLAQRLHALLREVLQRQEQHVWNQQQNAPQQPQQQPQQQQMMQMKPQSNPR